MALPIFQINENDVHQYDFAKKLTPSHSSTKALDLNFPPILYEITQVLGEILTSKISKVNEKMIFV